MTGPDPAEKKPARSTSSRAKTPKPDASAGSEPIAEPAAVAEPAAPVVAEPEVAVAAEPVAVAAAAPQPVPAQAPQPVPAQAPAPAPVIEAPSVVEAPTVVAATSGPVAEPAAAPTEPAAPAEAPASPSGPSGASDQGTTAAKLSTPDIAGAVDKAVDRLRTHLTVGEIVAGLGAVIILAISWLTFGFIFGHTGTWPSQLVMLLCVGMLGALVLQNAHIHDFGPNYRVIIAGICFALGLLATLSFLQGLRLVFNGVSFDIGGLTWWAGAWVSVIGGFLVWREGR